MTDAATTLAEPMTVAQFVVWAGERDTLYELVNGRPIPKHAVFENGIWAMAPARGHHGILQGNAYTALKRQLRKSCRAMIKAGVVRADDADEFRVPDVLVRCGDNTNLTHYDDPRVIIEVLSASTERTDFQDKLLFYQALPTVTDIVIIRQERKRATHYQRVEKTTWRINDLIGDATLTLTADVGDGAPVTLLLVDLYEDLLGIEG